MEKDRTRKAVGINQPPFYFFTFFFALCFAFQFDFCQLFYWTCHSHDTDTIHCRIDYALWFALRYLRFNICRMVRNMNYFDKQKKNHCANNSSLVLMRHFENQASYGIHLHMPHSLKIQTESRNRLFPVGFFWFLRNTWLVV